MDACRAPRSGQKKLRALALRRASNSSSDAESDEVRVLRLQSQAGNQAVTSLLAGDTTMSVQRDIAMSAKDLLKAEGFKFDLSGRYEEIYNLLKLYHETKELKTKLYCADVIKKLCLEWSLEHQGAKAAQEQAQLKVINDLELQARKEVEDLRFEERYVDMLERTGEGGGFHLSDRNRQTALEPAKLLYAGKYKSADNYFSGADKPAKKLVKKYGLTLGEIAATRIFSLSDYAYMNPAMTSTEKPKEEEGGPPAVRKNVAAVAKKIKQSLDPDISRQDPETMAEEGAVHASMALRGLKKLPDFDAKELYRGLRLSQEEFDNSFGSSRITSRPGFSSASIDPDVARSYANGKGGDMKLEPDQVISVFCTIVPSQAKDIAALSATKKDEREAMFLPGSQFLILEKEQLSAGPPGHPTVQARQWWNIKMVELDYRVLDKK